MHDEQMHGPQPAASQASEMPMTEEEYLAQVARDLPGGKPPSRAKSMLLLAVGAALIFGVLIVCRSMGSV